MTEKVVQKQQEEILRKVTRHNGGEVIVSKIGDVVHFTTPFSCSEYTLPEVKALGRGFLDEGMDILVNAGATLPGKNLKAGTMRLFNHEISQRMSKPGSQTPK